MGSCSRLVVYTRPDSLRKKVAIKLLNSWVIPKIETFSAFDMNYKDVYKAKITDLYPTSYWLLTKSWYLSGKQIENNVSQCNTLVRSSKSKNVVSKVSSFSMLFMAYFGDLNNTLRRSWEELLEV